MNRYANSEISLHVGGCGFDRQRGLVGFGGRAVHPDHIPIVASPFRDFADFGTAARQRRGSNRKLRLALIGTGWRDLSRRSGLCDSSLEEDGFEPSVPRGMGRRYSILRHSTASSMGVLSVLTIRFGPRTAAVTYSEQDGRAGNVMIGRCYPIADSLGPAPRPCAIRISHSNSR